MRLRSRLSNVDKEKLQLFLSHHLEGEYDRCLNLPFGSKHWRICTRCFGVYTGIAFGIISNLLMNLDVMTAKIIVFLFPLPAFVDFYLNQVDINEGSNFSRLSTGILLGFMYPTVLYSILMNPLSVYPYIALAGYGLLALLLINKKKTSRL